MTLHIFNPEHDMALAADTPNWTSPHAGRQLRADLGWIPALWSEDGDIVIVDDADAATEDYRRVRIPTPKKDMQFLTLADIQKSDLRNEITAVDPWGWDKPIRAQLRSAGVQKELLPADSELDEIRKISGRQLTTDLMPYLRSGVEEQTCGEVFVAKTLEEIVALKAKYKSIVVKAPWSCSGRGVRYLLEKEMTLTDNQERWIQNQLRQQGELMVEPLCNKVMDFGMEFVAIEGRVEYKGLSLFSTVNGAYTGNILATEDEKREMLSRYVSLDMIDEIQQRICTFMTSKLYTTFNIPLGSAACNKQELSTFNFYFGVDMMLCYREESFHIKHSTLNIKLNPCIELNFRRTMGHTALALAPTMSGKKQIMRIGYEGKAYHLRLYNNEEIYI